MVRLNPSKPHHELADETAKHLFTPLWLKTPESMPSDEELLAYATDFYGLSRFHKGNRAERLAKFLIVDGFEETILDISPSGGIETYRGEDGASCAEAEITDDIWEWIAISQARHEVTEAFHLEAVDPTASADVQAMQALDSVAHHAVEGEERKNNGRPYDLHQLEVASLMWFLTGRLETVKGIEVPLKHRLGFSYAARAHDSLEYEFKNRRKNPVAYYGKDPQRIITTARVIKSLLDILKPEDGPYPDPGEVASAIRQMSFVILNGEIEAYEAQSANLGGNRYSSVVKPHADNKVNAELEPMDIEKVVGKLKPSKRDAKRQQLLAKRRAMVRNIYGDTISDSPNSALRRPRGRAWSRGLFEYGRTYFYDPALLAAFKDEIDLEKLDFTDSYTADEMRTMMPSIVKAFIERFELPERHHYTPPSG